MKGLNNFKTAAVNFMLDFIPIQQICNKGGIILGATVCMCFIVFLMRHCKYLSR